MPAFLPRAFVSVRRVLIVFLPILLACASQAQRKPDRPTPAALTTVKSSAPAPSPAENAEVSLDLVVRTSRHKPVVDLQSSELTVIDDGTPVRLSSLRLVKPDSGPEHLVTLIFDQLNGNAAKMARKMAAEILAAFPAEGYTYAVLEENGRLQLLQSWTPNRRLVDAVVMQATAQTMDPPPTGATPAEKNLIASLHSDTLAFTAADRRDGQSILDALEQSQHILEERRRFPTLAAIQALVSADQNLSGRKFIFYFSAGKPWSSDTHEIVRSIVGQANRAGVTIGVVNTASYDPQMSSTLAASLASTMLGSTGISGVETSAGLTGAAAPTSAMVNSLHARDTADYEFGDINADQGPLVTLASGTAGIYLGGTQGTKEQLRELHEDLSAWYQASWTSPVKDFDGQFRTIDIWSSRKHLAIRGPTGYFAAPPSGFSEIHPFEMPLLRVLDGSTLPGDLAYQTKVLHLGALPDGNAADLVVQVPVSELAVREDGNTHISTADAAMVAVIKDSQGNILQRFGQDFPVHEAPEILQSSSGQVLTLQRQFSADPGVYTVETAVLDRIGDKTGAQRTTFTIEPPAAGASLSDIALVGSIEPADDNSRSFFEPMQYRDGQIVPSLNQFLPEKTRSLSLFFLVHPAAGSATQPTLHLQVFRNNQLLGDIPMHVDKVAGTGAAVPCLAMIQGRTFPPGAYQVKALLSQDGATASSQTSFRVEGTIAASDAPTPSLTAVSGESAISAREVADAATANSQFVISSPTNPLPVPSAAAIRDLMDGARRRALGWSDTLVNFYCLEVTNHFVEARGEGGWKQKGTLLELMKYLDHGESRSVMQLNDEPASFEPNALQFFHSTGEFGAMFHMVFDPSARAAFTWERSAFLDGQPVQVFAFRVLRAHSTFDLTDRKYHNQPVGFHGLVYLDPATRSVRRISVNADDIPATLLIRACSLSVDYSWIALGKHDFLLPVRGAVSLQETGKRPVLNQFEFRNYRRFGSQVRMLSGREMNELAQQ